MANSEKFFRVVEKHGTAITLTAILALGGILLACGFGSITDGSETRPEPTLPPLSQWVKARCQFQNTATGESHDLVVIAPIKEGGVGYENLSLCYKKDPDYKRMIDEIQNGKVDRNDVSIGQMGGPVTQVDIGQ